MQRTRSIAVVILCLCLSVSCENFKIKNPTPQSHFQDLRSQTITRANAGDIDAMFSMGEYLSGQIWLGDKIARPDLVSAIKWYTKAARKNHIKAKKRLAYYQTTMGKVLFNSEMCGYVSDLAQNKPEEIQWALQLAQWYRLGHVCEKNWQQAEKWFRYAKIHAASPLPRSVFQQWANLYIEGGYGIQRNLKIAASIFNIGIQSGGHHELYLEQYRVYLNDGDGLKAITALNQYNIHYKKDSGWDDINIYLYMADIYRYGRGNVNRSKEKAIAAYQKALLLQDKMVSHHNKQQKTIPAWYYKKAARIQTHIADVFTEFSDYAKASVAYVQAEDRWEICFKKGGCNIKKDSLILISQNQQAYCQPIMRKLPTSKYYYTRTQCHF